VNILLVNAPSRRGSGGFSVPMGLLYAGAIMERCGHQARIIDPYLNDRELERFDGGDFKEIDRAVEELRPRVIGYGGIATSYGRAKRLSRHLREKFPGIIHVAGGPLASTAPWLLEQAGLDAVFHGETETSLPLFLERVSQGQSWTEVPGISWLKDGKAQRNAPPPQIENLDSIPLPAYHLIDVAAYGRSLADWSGSYGQAIKEIPGLAERAAKLTRHGDRYIPIITSRGCTHRCLFCYRHVKGVRRHSVGYVLAHMRLLKERYGFQGFLVSDELFNSDTQWVRDFCSALEREMPGLFYIVAGARVDKVDEALLSRLRDTGCLEIGFGHESGSDQVLRQFCKGATAAQNRDMTLLARRIGLHAPIQIVIGAPAETRETISETIRFLEEISAPQVSVNYLIALPETPVWKTIEERGLVKDVESYLDEVADCGGGPLLNLTAAPDREWANWCFLIQREVDLRSRRKAGLPRYVLAMLAYKASGLVPGNLRRLVPAPVKRLIKRIV